MRDARGVHPRARPAQAQKEFPPDFANCKDKFLVQTKMLAAGEVRASPARAAAAANMQLLRRLLLSVALAAAAAWSGS